MNELDYILLLIVVGGIGIGLRRGFVRVLISTIGIYFTVIVAGYAYEPIGDTLSSALSDVSINLSVTAAHNVIYILAVVAMTVAVELVSRSTFEETHIRSLRGLDNLLGGLVGVFYGALWASLFLVPAQYGIARGGTGWSTAVLQSTLVPRLNQVFGTIVLDAVGILFIGGTPELFLNGVSQRVSSIFLDLASIPSLYVGFVVSLGCAFVRIGRHSS